MSIVMKNKLSATALAIATIMSMGYSTMSIADEGTADFQATIAVTTPNECLYTTSAGGSWDLNWNLANEGDANGTLSPSGSTGKEPLELKVNVNDGVPATCDLNNISIQATMGSAVPAGEGSYAYRVSTSDGFWRYMPMLARVQLYTDNAFTTPATGTVNIDDPDGNGFKSTSTSNSEGQTVMTPASYLNWGATKAYALSNGYLNNGGYAPLRSPDVPDGKTTMTSSVTTDKIKSVAMGITSIVANDPEKVDGSVYVNAVHDGESVSMPFTVHVSYE